MDSRRCSASGESDEGLPEGARDAGLSQERERTGVDSRSDVPRALPRDGASLPQSQPENPAETRSTSTRTSVEHREHTSFVIPGVSMQRTEFTALSHPADTAQVTPQAAAAGNPARIKAAPLHAPVSFRTRARGGHV